jgi:Flp pilus assembly protein TadG
MAHETGSPISSSHGEKGHAVIEAALLLPWILFLFIGVFDLGFYNYSLISTENAARIAAWYTSQSTSTAADSTTACTYALAELQALPNVGTQITSCNGSPVTVTATLVSSGADGALASQVTVSYKTPQLIPIPGALSGQFTFSRSVEMRLVTQ